jgi:penicillin-binding protein 1A
MVAATAAMVVVCAGLIVGFGAIALAIEWDIPDPQELLGPSTVYDRDGVAFHRFRADVERRPVPLEAISPTLRDAVIATEDHRFYDHDGVDPFSLVRAVVSNLRTGSIEQGGSTLTQQYVKNAYVGSDRTVARKIREAVVSIQLEKDLSKDEILAEYLNRVYFGDGAYGAEAAARSYFGVPASELTLSQSAVLASTLTAPSLLSPRADPAGAVARRDAVLDEMVRYGIRPAAEVEAAKLEPITLAPTATGQPAAP